MSSRKRKHRRWDRDDDDDDDHKRYAKRRRRRDYDDDDDDDDDDDRDDRRTYMIGRSRRPRTDDVRSGHDTLASIERALREVERQEKQIQTKIEAVNSDRGELLAQRIQSYKALAEVRARNALSDGVINHADNLSLQVASLLEARQKTISDLKVRHSNASEQRDQLIANAREASTKINSLEAQLDELARHAQDVLAKEPAYKAMAEELERARKVHNQASLKTEQAEADRKTKGAAYENDPLFMYLWNRKYRSDDYEASNLIRWLDEKLASFVGYHGARANYAVLRDIPEKLREHVNQLGDRLIEDERRVAQVEADKIKELAGVDLASELATARAEENEINSAIDRNAAEISEADGQLNLYLEGKDRAFQQAVDVSSKLLQQDSINQLLQLARMTPEPTDDQLVGRIDALERNIEKHAAESDKLRGELDTLFQRREELIRISADFRQKHYDDPGSVFEPGSGMEDLLQEFLRGVITGADYWARSQGRQRWRTRTGDSYRRSSNLPPFGDGWAGHWDIDIGGGGWSGSSGNWGGGSSGGRDGFDTGGGF